MEELADISILDNDTCHDTIRTFQGLEYDINDPKFQGLSKSAIKRLIRHEQWAETKEARKSYQREKFRQKRKEKRQLVREGVLEKPVSKKKLAHQSQQLNMGLILDCGFSHLMTEKELYSLVSQLSYTYGRNKTAPKAMKMCLTSFDTPLEQMLDSKLPDWTHWQLDRKPECYMDHYDPSTLVYLTADSTCVIDRLEEGKNYIVGGIVDKNRYKNLCLDKANQQAIQTAQLPISEYLSLSTRKVLTVNQVCDIMLKWNELGDWQEAFLQVIPERKLKDATVIT
ncbi:guanine-1-methyltransferase-domain-containing protein [Choanephora cucurbitarum]|nr:guanine-1-methyltransferase-domain-containing protein [Choanephora cucurbitarum]